MTSNTHITVALTPEQRLEQALKNAGIDNPSSVVKLTVTGTVTDDDFRYIRLNMAETLQFDMDGAFEVVDESTPEYQLFLARLIGKTNDSVLRDKCFEKINTDTFLDDVFYALLQSSSKDVSCIWTAEQMLECRLDVISEGSGSFYVDVAKENP